jgi:hypothetical protein
VDELLIGGCGFARPGCTSANPDGQSVRVSLPPGGDRLLIEDVRPFVPAIAFDVSNDFHEALGWSTAWTDGGGLALMEAGNHRSMLKDYYVQEWAENSMLSIIVPDAAARFERVSLVLSGRSYGDARPAEPKVEPWEATVTYVWDPCGVLLHSTQWA